MSAVRLIRPNKGGMIITSSVLAAIMLVGGCGVHREREHVRQTLARVDKTAVVAEATSLWARRRSNWNEEVPAADWPPTIRQFEPDKVTIDGSGVFVCTLSVFVHDAGLFIALDPNFQPAGKTDPTYEPLGGVFYWFNAPG